MEAFGLGGRWAYRDEASGKTFGMSEREVREVCRTADLFVSVSCSTFMREEYVRIPARVLVDSDPMFTQIQYLSEQMFTPGQPGLRALVDAHTHLFTFGENVGAQDCRMPTCGLRWRPTRQPVCLERWRVTDLPKLEGAAYTTLMNWTAAKPLEFEGETWGRKDVEFALFSCVPGLAPGIPLAVAVGQTGGAGKPFPKREVEAGGWRVLAPEVCAPEWRSYRAFLEGSRGEFSVAKETYVKARTGWFSCRSACYLAAGRPVVTQETGWSKHVAAGAGLFTFEDAEGAADALRRIERDWQAQARGARLVAGEHFDSRRVLGRTLSQL